MQNTKTKDNGAKLIFYDPILCAQLLRGYSNIELLKDVQPEYLLHLISMIVAVFLYRFNIPRNEVEQFVDKIERREFDMLFDSVEVYDVQETRRISKAAGI